MMETTYSLGRQDRVKSSKMLFYLLSDCGKKRGEHTTRTVNKEESKTNVFKG